MADDGIVAPAMLSPVQPAYNAPLPPLRTNGLGLSGAVLPVDMQGRTIAVDEMDSTDVKGNGDALSTMEEAPVMKREENPYFPTVSSIPGPNQASTSSAHSRKTTAVDVVTPRPTRKQTGKISPLAKPTTETLVPAPVLHDVPAPKPVLDMVAPTPLPSGMNDISIHGIGRAGALSLDAPVEGSWMSTSPPGLVQGATCVPSPKPGMPEETGSREAMRNGDVKGAEGVLRAAHTNGVGRTAEADIAATSQPAANGVPALSSLEGLTLEAEDEEEEGKVMFPTSAKPDVNAVDSVSSYHAFLAQWCFARGEDAKEVAAVRGT